MIKHKALAITALLLIALSQPGLAQVSLMTPEEMWGDLDYVADLVRRVHPEPFHSRTEAEFEQLVNGLKHSIVQPMPRDDFYYVVNQVAAFVKDGHTFVALPEESRYVPARFQWVSDGIVVSQAHEESGLEFGDQVLEVGGLTPHALLGLLEPILIAENPHALRNRAGSSLSSGSLLDYLGLVTANGVEFLVESVSGEVRRVVVELKSSEYLPDLPKRPWFGWYVDADRNLGYFYLDECNYNQDYIDALEQFFAAVQEQDIGRVVLDVRQNSGGDSQVIQGLLAYLPHRKVAGYGGEIRYSPEASEQRGYEKTDGYLRISSWSRLLGKYNMNVPLNREYQFAGDVYILTSSVTFSAANWFAVVFQDNKLGQVLGEPTGNAPTSYGDILRFTLPNSRLPMIMSHKSWVRPNPKRDPSDALYPDIYIPTTIQDIRKGIDPQMEWFREGK